MKPITKMLTTLFAAAILGAGSVTAAADSGSSLEQQSLTVTTAQAQQVTQLDAVKAPAKPTWKSSYDSTRTKITIKWNKVSGASGYRVYRYDSGKKKWLTLTTIKSGSTIQYTDTGRKPGTLYKYKVKAYKKSGGKNVWGKASDEKWFVTNPAVVKIKSASATKDSITLKWDEVKGSGYKVYQKIGGEYKLIKTISGSSTTSYKVTGLKDDTKYSFKVKAFKKDKTGTVKNGGMGEISKKTKAYEKPIAIKELKATKVSETSYKLSWTTIKYDSRGDTCDGYEIYLSEVGEAPSFFYKKNLDIKNGNTNTATVSNLYSNTEYSFKVIPYNLKKDGTKVYYYDSIKEELNNYHTRECSFTTGDDGKETFATKNVKVTAKVDYEESYKCLKLINNERKQEGLNTLTMDETLLNNAVTRCFECIYKFDHERPNGSLCFSMNNSIRGENILYGTYDNYDGWSIGFSHGDDITWYYSTSELAYDTWKNSQGHHKNYMSSDYKSTGLAIVEVECGDYMEHDNLCFFYAVQLFSDESVKSKAVQPKNQNVTKTIEVKKYTWKY